jgi:hypothetical protein
MIVDCCTYFMEADLLALRLAELDPVVDRFVVVEGNRTHAGAPKESHLRANFARFQPYAHKLTLWMADLPEGDGLCWTWRREIAQRNAIADALASLHLNHDDMILISDCDEIPRRGFVNALFQLQPDTIAVAVQRLHYYTFNHVAPDAQWFGTRATQYANVQALGADGVRYAGHERGGFPRIAHAIDAGWHFSYFGGPEYVKTKIESFLHQELNHPEHRDEATIKERIANGQDVYGRDWQNFTIGAARDLPSAVYEQPMGWAHHFHPEYAPAFHEDWTGAAHSTALTQIASFAPPEGICAEIGSWEGVSTIAIAYGLGERTLYAVDTWAGNSDEDPNHYTVGQAKQRDVYAQFLRNIEAYGRHFVEPKRCDWRVWAERNTSPIAFLHLDAAHDEQSVSEQLAAFLPRLVPGGIICGDDYYAEGVQRAVRAALPDHVSNGRIWWWRRMDAS